MSVFFPTIDQSIRNSVWISEDLRLKEKTKSPIKKRRNNKLVNFGEKGQKS